MRKVNILWVLVFLTGWNIQAQQLKNYNMDAEPAATLSSEQRVQLDKTLRDLLRTIPPRPQLRSPVQLIWPVRQASDHDDYLDIFAVSAYFDHDDRRPNRQLDYQCGTHTHDNSQRNHTGTDILLWPFGWHQMDRDQAEVIAAASGQIMHKQDGHYDRNCPAQSVNNPGNGVFVLHDDGTIAVYLNLKAGSLTNKAVGDRVSAGEFLGVPGSSGDARYPQLHFELRDSDGKPIDPFTGPCNPGESYWADQPAYLETGANYLSTYTEHPDFNNLCEPATQYEQRQFQAGDSLFFLAFIRNQRNGQIARMRVLQPNGQPLTDRSSTIERSSPRSYFVHAVQLPDDAPQGSYTCILNLANQEYTTSFQVTGGGCPVPDPANMVAQVFGPTEAQVTYRSRTYTGYHWQIRKSGASDWTDLPTEAYSVYIRGLSPNTDYDYRVRFWCNGGWSPWSALGHFRTLNQPNCPVVDLANTQVALPDPTTAQITINLPGKDAYDWRIRLPDERWNNVISQSDNQYTFTGLTANTTYEYAVRVRCDNTWSSWSAPGSFTTPSGPQCVPPTLPDFSVQPLSSTEAQLTSLPNEKKRYDWRVRPSGSSGWISLESTAAFAVVLRGLSPGTSYDLQHRWICEESWSDWSPTVSFSTPASDCPQPVLDDLTWSFPNPEKIDIALNTASGSAFQVRYRSTQTENWTVGSAASLPLLSFPVTPGNSYTFQVRIFCGQDWSPWSDAQLITAPETPSCPVPQLDQTAVELLSSYSVRLVIDSLSQPFWQMRYRPQGQSAWILLDLTDANHLLLDNLSAETAYVFQIRQICDGTPGDWSETGLFSTPALNVCPEVTDADILIIDLTEQAVQLSGPFFPDLRYQWRYRLAGQSGWNTLPATNAPSLVLEGLSAGTAYEVQLRILCGFDNGEWSPKASFTTMGLPPCPPPAHERFSISSIGPTGAIINLNQAEQKTQYRLRYRPVGQSTWDTLTTTQPEFILTGLLPNTSYSWQVSWRCPQRWSDWTEALDLRTDPLPVCHTPEVQYISEIARSRTSLTVRLSTDTAQLYQWRYRIVGSNTWIFLQNQPETTLTLENLEAGTEYAFQVRQACTSGLWSDWSGSAIWSTLPPYSCSAPVVGDMVAEQITQQGATLRYTGAAATQYQWRIRASGSNEWVNPGVSNSAMRVFSNLQPGTTYQFQLRIDCGEGWSPWSSTGLFSTLAELPCPLPADSEIFVDVLGEQEVRLEVHLSELESYHFRYRELGDPIWQNVGPQEAPTALLNNLQAGTTYEFQIRVQCINRWSDWTAPDTFTTPQQQPVCRRPQSNDINVYLLPNVRGARLFVALPDAEGFEWRLRRRGRTEWQTTGQEVDPSWLIADLRGETTYEYQVRVLCASGWTNWSPIGDFTTPLHRYCDDPQLSQSSVQGIRTHQVDLSLSIPDAQAYEWQYRLQGFDNWLDAGQSNDPAITLTGLLAERTYDYRFRYECEYGWSDWSPVGSFTTLPPENLPTCNNPIFDLEFDPPASVRLLSQNEADAFQWRYRDISTFFYLETTPSSESTTTISDLEPETTYRFQLRIRCDGIWSDWSSAQQIITPAPPACPTPSAGEVQIDVVSPTEVFLRSGRNDAVSYDWRFRPAGTTEWLQLSTEGDPTKRLSGLAPASSYEVQHRVLCLSGWSDWSPAIAFTTTEQIPDPDLTCGNQPPIAVRNDSVWINGLSILNQGEGPAAATVVHFFLSPDGSPGPSAIALDTVPFGALAANATAVINRVIVLGAITMPLETYKLGYQIDPDDLILESNEDNNQCFWNTPDIAQTPDPNSCPTAIEVSGQPGLSHVYLQWSSGPTANLNYEVRFRDAFVPIWDTYTVSADTFLVLTGLDPCTEYVWQVRPVCTPESNWSSPQNIRTTGCSALYCYSYGLGRSAYIQSVSFQGTTHVSGNDYGYGNHTDQPYHIPEDQPLQLEARALPADEFATFDQVYWRIWIDRDQDGRFADEGELWLEQVSGPTGVLNYTGAINLPPSETPYRIRLAISPDRFPQVCAVETQKYTEDYQIHVDMMMNDLPLPRRQMNGNENSGRIFPQTTPHTQRPALSVEAPFPNPFRSRLQVPLHLAEAGSITWQILGNDGVRHRQQTLQLDSGHHQLDLRLHGLPPGYYQLRIVGPADTHSWPLIRH